MALHAQRLKLPLFPFQTRMLIILQRHATNEAPRPPSADRAADPSDPLKAPNLVCRLARRAVIGPGFDLPFCVQSWWLAEGPVKW
jgi:hypothetical protein